MLAKELREPRQIAEGKQSNFQDGMHINQEVTMDSCIDIRCLNCEPETGFEEGNSISQGRLREARDG
ncbi:hypothetical protein V1478_009668 [Vespula squamosa]|uniref:Uncharacterized protein n=1 Tax=Vespula squamosa TaxID=30214 RepID=A0ABD2AQL7_VESSQ